MNFRDIDISNRWLAGEERGILERSHWRFEEEELQGLCRVCAIKIFFLVTNKLFYIILNC